MGILDFLFDKEKAEERRLNKLRKTLSNMYKQAGEREYAIQTLREKATPEAVRVLMARFDEQAPNTTVDADEKRYVYETIVDMAANPELDVEQIVADYLREKDEKINWPMKVMSDLLEYQEMIDLVRELLETCDTGFQRNPEKKQELILRATDLKDEDLSRELLRFLEDDNETIRFLAVETLLKHDFEEIIEDPLRERLREEESLRIIKTLAAAFADRKDWKIPEDEQEEIDEILPEEYGVHKHGHIYRKRT